MDVAFVMNVNDNFGLNSENYQLFKGILSVKSCNI